MAYKREKIGGSGKNSVTRHHNSKTGKTTVSHSSKPGNVRTTHSSNGTIRQTWVDSAGYRHTRVNTGKSVNAKAPSRKRSRKQKGGIISAIVVALLALMGA